MSDNSWYYVPTTITTNGTTLTSPNISIGGVAQGFPLQFGYAGGAPQAAPETAVEWLRRRVEEIRSLAA